MKALVAFLIVSVVSVFSMANTPGSYIDRNPDHRCHHPSSSCVQLGCFYEHCDFDSDIEKITRACQGVWDDGCIRAICNRKGDCSFITKFIKYTELCGRGRTN